VAADLIASRPFDDWSGLLKKVGGLGKGYREAMEPFVTFGPDGSNVQLEAPETEPHGESVNGVDEDPDEIEEPQAPKPRRGRRTKAA
jgi:hypothetical protein